MGGRSLSAGDAYQRLGSTPARLASTEIVPNQINQNSISGLIARARRPGSGGGVVAREAERLPERSVEVVFDQALLGGGGNANA